MLVATESYEVGTHSPHVNVVLRIGCMRNIKDYEQAWKWVYGLKAGSCLRKCLLEKFENVDVMKQAPNGDCCSSCDISDERSFDVKQTAKLLLTALDELSKIPSIKDVNEDKVLSWLRGSRRNWLSTPEIQSKTYGKGQYIGKQALSKEWWSMHLRQIAHLNLININFKISKGFQFP